MGIRRGKEGMRDNAEACAYRGIYPRLPADLDGVVALLAHCAHCATATVARWVRDPEHGYV